MSKISRGGGGWETIDHTGFHQLASGKKVVIRAVTTPAGDNTYVPIPDFSSRVDHGMDILDRVAPGWHEEIDTTILDLFDEDHCVLGQTWPHFQRLADQAHHVITLADDDLMMRSDGRLKVKQSGFRLMTRALIHDGGMAAQADWAASIGCALATEDCTLANVTAKHVVYERLGESESLLARTIMTDFASATLRLYFEELTRTWLQAIIRARRSGRWNTLPSLPTPQPSPWMADSPSAVAVERERELLRV